MVKKEKIRKYELKILISALFLIIVLFFVFSFNNTEIKKSPDFSKEDKTTEIENAIIKGEENFEVILKIPSYLEESLAHPQKFFSGRKIKIIKKTNDLIGSPNVVTLAERDFNTKTLVSSIDIETSKKTTKDFAIEIPMNTKTGYYTIEFEDGGERIMIPINIIGLTQEEENALGNIPSIPSQLILGTTKYLHCNCYWESVLAINPNNEDLGYLVGPGSNLVQTVDGWDTWQLYNINDLTTPLLREYLGDPKIEFDSDGRLILTSLLHGQGTPYSIIGGFYTDSSPNNMPPQLVQTILQYEPENLPPGFLILFDYEKLAIDTYQDSPFLNSKYIFAQLLYFEDTQTFETGLFIVRDNQITKHRTRDLGNGDFVHTPQSAIIGPGGIIYAARGLSRNEIFVHTSSDGGRNFIKRIIQLANPGLDHCSVAKVSTTSDRAWFAYRGPEMAVDRNGRIYAVWAEYNGCIMDPDFEYEAYAIDYDIYISFSDNNGITWSDPLRVNDDFSLGHQVFPSIFVDEDNIVYVTFIDHRDQQDEAQFDIYLAQSIDRGQSFSRNIRLNEISIPNVEGYREPGDYLDMLQVGDNNIFVSYPCLDTRFPPPYSHANDACITKIRKPLEYNPQMPANPSFEADSGIDYYPSWNADDNVASNNLPDGYWSFILSGTGSIILDDQNFHSGNKSVRLNINNPGRGFSGQDIPVEYNKRYRVSGYVKTDCNDHDCYGTILSQCADINHNNIQDYSNCKLNINPVDIRRLYGDNDWTYIEFDVENNRQDARFLRVLCYNTPAPNPVGSGTVWCDSLNVIEVPRGGVGSPMFLKPIMREIDIG